MTLFKNILCNNRLHHSCTVDNSMPGRVSYKKKKAEYQYCRGHEFKSHTGMNLWIHYITVQQLHNVFTICHWTWSMLYPSDAQNYIIKYLFILEVFHCMQLLSAWNSSHHLLWTDISKYEWGCLESLSLIIMAIRRIIWNEI